MVRFGFVKGLPKPRTKEDWLKLYSPHRTYLYGIKQVTVEWSKKGRGQTGTRHFHYFKVPSLRHWNPDVSFVERKYADLQPRVTLLLADGSTKEILTADLHSDAILAKVQEAPRKRSSDV